MAQRKFIIDGGFTTNADSSLTGNLDMTGHIIPTVDSNGTTGYDLGSPDFKWRDLYLSQGSLYIDGQKVIESNSGTIVVQADAGQSLTTKVSGAGVMTLESATTVNMASTLQMQTGKKITDQGGNAVVFGDKVDMDNNQIINVGVPTADEHAATKSYVDNLVGGISESAITAGDSEVAIADLGTGTVGITVDGVQKLALSAAQAAFTVPVTVNGATLETESGATAKADQALVDAKAYTDTRETAITTAYEAADTTLTSAVNVEKGRIDAIMAASTADADTFAEVVALVNSVDATNDSVLAGEIANRIAGDSAVTTAMESYADTAEADAIATASADATAKADQALVDAKAYADTAEADAIASAEAKDVVRATAAATDATTKADAAQSAAEATASADATAKADQALVDAKAYADTAEADAVNAAAATSASNNANTLAAAATDATTKADQALVDAKAYTDTAEADAIASAEAKDVVRATAAASDATTKADAAQSAAEATASADATAKANAAQVAAISAAQTKADTAEANAIASASVTATTKADTAEANATSAAATDATNKANAAEDNANAYTDTEIASLIDSAPGALDTLNELAAAMGDDANFAATISTNIATETSARIAGDAASVATAAADATTKADAALVDAKAYTDTAETSITTAFQSYADQAELDAIATAAADATTKADTAEADAISTAATDATTKADAAQSAAATDATTKAAAAQSDAEDTAEAKDVVRAAAAASDATAKANSAQSAAEATASADATAKANAAQSAAEATASADATAKANAALSTAQAYADQAEVDAKGYADTGISNLESSLTHFHSSVVDVTAAVSTSNSSASVNYTFSELSNARHYVVLLNRQVLRPSEYSVSGTTLTIQTGVLATDDELEVTGLSS